MILLNVNKRCAANCTCQHHELKHDARSSGMRHDAGALACISSLGHYKLLWAFGGAYRLLAVTNCCGLLVGCPQVLCGTQCQLEVRVIPGMGGPARYLRALTGIPMGSGLSVS